MLTLTGVGKRFGTRIVLRGVTLHVPKGTIALVSGPNGSGKSTLLSIMAGLTHQDAGSVHRSCAPSKVAFIGHATFTYANLSAIENLTFWERLFHGDASIGRLHAILERVGLGPFADMRVGDFSRGMTQRLNIARILLREPELLLLDEPSTGLDTAGLSLLRDEITSAKRRGSAVVWVTHTPEIDKELADDVFEIAHGTMDETHTALWGKQ